MISIRKKAALSNYLFGQSQNVFIIVNGIILVPLYLKYISLDLYGAWLASGNIISWLGAFESGIGIVLTQRLANSLGEHKPSEYSQYVFAGLSIIGLISISIALVGIAISAYIPVWFKISESSGHDLELAFFLASIAAGLGTMASTLGALPQACLRTVGMGFVNLVAMVLGLIITGLAITSGMGVSGFGYGLVARSGLQCFGLVLVIVFHWKVLRLPNPSWSSAFAKNLWNDAGPMFIARLGRTIGDNSQTVISASIISPSAAAILVLSSRLVLAVKMLVGQISSATFGGLANSFGTGNIVSTARTFKQINSITSALLAIGLSCAFVFNQALINLWVGNEKYGGDLLNLLIVIAALVEVMTNSNSSMLQAMGRFRITALIEVIGTAFRIVLIILLGNYFGLNGLVAGSIVAVLVINGFALPKLVGKTLGLDYKDSIISIIGDPSIIFVCIFVSIAWKYSVGAATTWNVLIIHNGIFLSILMAIGFFKNRYLGK